MSGDSFAHYARYYDLLYRDKDYAAEARFVDGILRGAGATGGGLLDVGCGSGRHAREFAGLGWRVAGIDASSAMIAQAREKAPAGAEFALGDAGAFDLGRRFAAVTALFHVVSYQAEPGQPERMFGNVRRHLERGGIFLFDFWHGPGVLVDPPAVRVRRMEDEAVRVTRISEPVHDAVRCRIDVHYEVLVEEKSGGGGGMQRIRELHRMRYFFLPEIESLLGQAGFVIEATRAGLTGEPLRAESWYGLIVARAV